MKKLPIGEIVYYFDQNYRVYKDDNGNKISSPNYRLYFRPIVIEKEDKNYYYFGGEHKISKRTGCTIGKFYGISAIYTKEEMENDIWVSNHKYRIIESMRQVKNIYTLKKIAELIGYKGD